MMSVPSLLSTRFRGFRIVNLLGLTVLLIIALGSYALKTFAGAQDVDAAAIEERIAQQQQRIHMLKAEVSRLGAPARVADLSRRYLNLAPLDPKRDIAVAALPALAARADATAAPQNQGTAP